MNLIPLSDTGPLAPDGSFDLSFRDRCLGSSMFNHSCNPMHPNQPPQPPQAQIGVSPSGTGSYNGRGGVVRQSIDGTGFVDSAAGAPKARELGVPWVAVGQNRFGIPF